MPPALLSLFRRPQPESCPRTGQPDRSTPALPRPAADRRRATLHWLFERLLRFIPTVLRLLPVLPRLLPPRPARERAEAALSRSPLRDRAEACRSRPPTRSAGRGPGMSVFRARSSSDPCRPAAHRQPRHHLPAPSIQAAPTVPQTPEKCAPPRPRRHSSVFSRNLVFVPRPASDPPKSTPRRH